MDKKQQQERAYIAAMAESMDKQDDPKVGIFWYDTESRELFGVLYASASELPFSGNGLKTLSVLHKKHWIKEKYRGRDPRYEGNDYTAIPRGRIFEKKIPGGSVFQLMVGSWIKDVGEDHVVQLVRFEFDLQSVELEVIIDRHWDIGHGWSDELF